MPSQKCNVSYNNMFIIVVDFMSHDRQDTIHYSIYIVVGSNEVLTADLTDRVHTAM